MNASIVADAIKCSLEKYQFTKILKIWSLNWSRSQDFRMRLHLWQSPSSEVTFYCEAPSKYIVVRKFMKKQCVAAPVAKKLAKKSDQLFMVLLFQWNLLLHFSYLIYFKEGKDKADCWIFSLCCFGFSQSFSTILFSSTYIYEYQQWYFIINTSAEVFF